MLKITSFVTNIEHLRTSAIHLIKLGSSQDI